MPRLRAFGKEWSTASDDAVIPATVNAIVTGSWLGSLLYAYLKNLKNFTCSGNDVVTSFFVGGMALSALELVVLVKIVRVGLKGTLINWTPRKDIGWWLGARMILQVASGLFSLQGVRWAYYSRLECSEAVLTTMKSNAKHAVVTALVAGLATFALVRRPVTKDEHHGHPHASNMDLLHELEVQQGKSVSVFSVVRHQYRKIKNMLQSFFGLRPDPTLTKVSQFISSYFEDDLDLVPSDILMALIKVAQRQSENRRTRSFEHCDIVDGQSFDVHPKSWMRDMGLHAHYFKYAYGAYGWWPYFVMSEKGALWKLFKIVVKGRYIPRGLPPFITGDNRLLANTTALQILTGLTMDNLVYVSFTNERFGLPFFVALDHVHKAIVVSVRGTLSIEDAIVDLYCFSEPLPNGHGEAHAGMLESAIVLKTKLLVENVGSHFESGRPLLEVAREKLSMQVGEERSKEYSLVITGHSLGAGTAGVLAVLMKDIPGFGNLKCFAFSPPGGLMSPNVAKYAEHFVCSVVLGDDIVGRLGLTQAWGFKAKILKTLKTLDIPKHEIMGDWLESVLSKVLRVHRKKQNKNSAPSWTGDAEAERQVLNFQQHIQDAYDEAEREKHKVALRPPGCLIFITEKQTSTFSIFGRRSTYEAYFTPCSSRLFSKLMLMPNMVRHHLPWAVMNALDSLADQGAQPLLKEE